MLPRGTITFLFTDIEGSTQLWEKYSQAMKAALAEHDSILREAIESNHGFVIKTTGDGIHAAFTTALDAIQAAVSMQRALHESFTPGLFPFSLKVRMGLHTGEAELRDGDYFGSVLNRTARLMSVAYGEQILLSGATAELVRGQLPADITLRDLGEHRLKDLTFPEHVFQVTPPDLTSEFPPLKSLASFPNNLPLQLTSFVGREKEIAEIKELLKTARLITFTGPGGTGKTRLAQEAGVQLLEDFPNGVWILELATLTDPSQIILSLAQVFGLKEIPFIPMENLVLDYLREKKLLLILDNCEHLIEACARLTDKLLHQCAQLAILASSREAMGIAGEAAYRIPSLTVAESTQLFVDRARSANPAFSLTDANAASIALISTRLDGIPLAIELAAVRVKLLSPEQISTRLDDRFRLLVGGSRTALPRQQTLRALIDWSYDLLTDDERRLLQFASVFVGGWRLDALEAVADDANTLELLEQLVIKSLVAAEEHGSQMRYFMLETIRQYAREKLFDARQSSLARDRHFAYYDHLSEELWNAFRSTDVLPMAMQVEEELENLRAAFDWGLENYVEENLRLAANFCLTSSNLGILAEGVARAKTAVERVKALPPAEGEAGVRRQKMIARALFAQGMVGLGLGDLPAVEQNLKEAIAISRVTGDKQLLGYSLEMYFFASTFISIPGGEDAAREGLKIFSQEINDRFGLGMAYLNMARVASGKGDEAEKQKYFREARAMIHEMPGAYQGGLFFLGMGLDERMRGNYETAKKIFEEGLEIFKRIRNTNFKLVMSSELGHIERYTGHPGQARAIYQETIRGWQDLGNRSAIAHQLESFGFLAIADTNPPCAIRLFGAADALREKIQTPMTAQEQVEYDQAVAGLRSMLAEEEFNAQWAEGRAMTMEQAIQFALES